MKHIYNDGGRELAGYKGHPRDCVVRAISIRTKTSYKEVYDKLLEYQKIHNSKRRKYKKDSVSPRNGVNRKVIKKYLSDLGWKWTPLMLIGSGCTVHMKSEELPKGIIIVSLSIHIACVIDGVLNDTYDCSRKGTRCVYGYWKKTNILN